MLILFTTNNKALIASPLRPQVRDTRNFIAEDFLINLLQNFSKKQTHFSQSKDINQQFIAFTDIFQNTMNAHAPFRTLTHKEVKGGEASSWDYVQKLKKHLKHFFTKLQLSTIYRFWDILFQSWKISPTVLPFEI